jgi:hypothetical protein
MDPKGSLSAANLSLFLDPPSYHFYRDGLFDVESERPNGDRILAPYAYLREWFNARSVAVHTADYLLDGSKANATNVYISFGIDTNCAALSHRPDVVLSALFATECPIVEPTLYRAMPNLLKYFKRIFSYLDAATLEHFIRRPIDFSHFFIPQSFETVHEDLWMREDRKFLVMINANKLPRVYWRELYTERLRALNFFSQTGEIDLYGAGWSEEPFRVGKTWVPWTLRKSYRSAAAFWHRVVPSRLIEGARRAYRGRAVSKSSTLSEYTFAICFENAVLSGWITEKIFDCFYAGTVPVYLGAPEIERYIPSECFIDMRKFADYSELRSFLKSLSLEQIRTYKQMARNFLRTPGFEMFSKQTFVKRIASLVEQDLGLRL